MSAHLVICAGNDVLPAPAQAQHEHRYVREMVYDRYPTAKQLASKSIRLHSLRGRRQKTHARTRKHEGTRTHTHTHTFERVSKLVILLPTIRGVLPMLFSTGSGVRQVCATMGCRDDFGNCAAFSRGYGVRSRHDALPPDSLAKSRLGLARSRDLAR